MSAHYQAAFKYVLKILHNKVEHFNINSRVQDRDESTGCKKQCNVSTVYGWKEKAINIACIFIHAFRAWSTR